jgi:hypothetical protein
MAQSKRENFGEEKYKATTYKLFSTPFDTDTASTEFQID